MLLWTLKYYSMGNLQRMTQSRQPCKNMRRAVQCSPTSTTFGYGSGCRDRHEGYRYWSRRKEDILQPGNQEISQVLLRNTTGLE
jgi:hypothetical protein